MPFTKNIQTDYGAAGNAQVATVNVTTTSGQPDLVVSSSIFVAGDVGKIISVAGAFGYTTILTFLSGTHVTLNANSSQTLSAQSMNIYWGSTDDSNPFLNWQTDAKAQGTNPCVLTVPAGVYLNPSAGVFWDGIFDHTINMTGATIAEFSRGGVALIGAPGVNTARVNQVNAGDITLNLVTPSQTSLFNVGDWFRLTSLEMQGTGGYPPNSRIFEYHQVVSKGTGTITMDSPAAFQHRTTWPFTGSSSYDSGGPATIGQLDQTWNQTVTINGGGTGVIDASGQCQLIARSMTLNNMTVYGAHGRTDQNQTIDVSECQSIVFNTCNCPLGFEVDKEISSFTLNNCTVDVVLYQSASVTNSFIIGGTIGDVIGFGINMDISGGATISALRVGNTFFGMGSRLTCENSTINQFDTTNNTGSIPLSTPMSFSSGIITVPNANASQAWPFGWPGIGAYWYMSSGGNGAPDWGNPVIVQDMWADSNNTYIRVTPVLGGVPNYVDAPGNNAGPYTVAGIVFHPCWNATFTNCTGADDVVDASGAPPNKPIFSYTKRTYVSGSIGSSSPQVPLRGYLTNINVNVTAAASGVGPLQLGFVVIRNNNMYDQVNGAFGPVQIDLTKVGLRTISQGKITGALGADVFTTIPPGLWVMGAYSPFVGTTITGGSVTIEIITDQFPQPVPTLHRMGARR